MYMYIKISNIKSLYMSKYSYATIAGIVALAILIVWAGGYDGTQSGEDISADAKMAKSISDAIEPSK